MERLVDKRCWIIHENFSCVNSQKAVLYLFLILGQCEVDFVPLPLPKNKSDGYERIQQWRCHNIMAT